MEKQPQKGSGILILLILISLLLSTLGFLILEHPAWLALEGTGGRYGGAEMLHEPLATVASCFAEVFYALRFVSRILGTLVPAMIPLLLLLALLEAEIAASWGLLASILCGAGLCHLIWCLRRLPEPRKEGCPEAPAPSWKIEWYPVLLAFLVGLLLVLALICGHRGSGKMGMLPFSEPFCQQLQGDVTGGGIILIGMLLFLFLLDLFVFFLIAVGILLGIPAAMILAGVSGTMVVKGRQKAARINGRIALILETVLVVGVACILGSCLFGGLLSPVPWGIPALLCCGAEAVALLIGYWLLRQYTGSGKIPEAQEKTCLPELPDFVPEDRT